ncbi:tRNA (adenine(22)-N(1))-methyltransferase [Staphylococcus felis]|uniref:tRNA methyltransferase n=1 Tax=Staphylococcus felis TaxID=46127 RepID=A0A3E0IQF6_9STAP|nr:tRNA (adenine(22)-N(1))-methyltransferase TrmK [Staphylococcus felis]REH84077.1 tRNA methyltransferase [Staphylococcus felis]REH89832.1 tRNA methyltransferase [Staphylococcus felis]REH96822.1 tRNA methyltransferase [Staphylococcus felis]
MMPINKRLKKVSEFVKGDILADIGSDHAYLPMYCLQNGKIQKAIAGEVIKGPYDAAVKNVELYGYQNDIDVRLGNGLTILNKHDLIDTVTICGMGGPLITKILNEGFSYLVQKPRFVLQSNIQSEPIRRFLQEHNYQIIEEVLIKDRHHIYEIIIAEPGQMNLSNKAFRFGPFLLKNKNSLFYEKWEREYEALDNILQNLDPRLHHNRYSEIQYKQEEIKEVLS